MRFSNIFILSAYFPICYIVVVHFQSSNAVLNYIQTNLELPAIHLQILVNLKHTYLLYFIQKGSLPILMIIIATLQQRTNHSLKLHQHGDEL